MEFIKLYLHHLSLQDYIGLGVVGAVFLLFFILSLILLFKKPLLGFILIIFTLMIPPVGFYEVYTFLNKTLRKSELAIKETKPLHFSNSLLIKANIKNLSKIDFNVCYIQLNIIKKSPSKIKKLIYGLKPLAVKSIYIYDHIPKNSSEELKKILDNTIYTKDDELTAKMDCY